MKKGLLNNPKFVFALAAGAFAVVGNNVLTPLMSGGSSTSDEVVPPVGLEFADENVSAAKLPADQSDEITDGTTEFRNEGQSSSVNKVREFPHIGWVVAPERDPFRLAKKRELEIRNQELTIEHVGKQKEDIEAGPIEVSPEQLSAVVIGPAFKLAIVDGQLLSQGEKLLNGSVKVLDSASVEYQSELGKRERISIEQLNLDPNSP